MVRPNNCSTMLSHCSTTAQSAEGPLASANAGGYHVAVTANLSIPAEALIREQIESGQFSSVDSAVEAAVQTVFGTRASKALESLLDEALQHEGRRVPLSELRQPGHS